MYRKVIRKYCFIERPAPDTLDETLPSEEFPIVTEQALDDVVVFSVATAVTDIPAVHVFAIMIPMK